jgi:hypothetical protein
MPDGDRPDGSAEVTNCDSTKARKMSLYDTTEENMGARISVRHILQQMLQEQHAHGCTLSIGLQRYEDLFGDPCPGTPKVLHVRYWLRGTVHTTTQVNNAKFSVGLSGLAVQRAWYGRTDRSDGRDVTPWVQDMVHISPTLVTSLEINGKYDTLFKSGVPGHKKPAGRVSLHLLYTVGAAQMLCEFQEDALICIQPGTNTPVQQNVGAPQLTNILAAVRLELNTVPMFCQSQVCRWLLQGMSQVTGALAFGASAGAGAPIAVSREQGLSASFAAPLLRPIAFLHPTERQTAHEDDTGQVPIEVAVRVKVEPEVLEQGRPSVHAKGGNASARRHVILAPRYRLTNRSGLPICINQVPRSMHQNADTFDGSTNQAPDAAGGVILGQGEHSIRLELD